MAKGNGKTAAADATHEKPTPVELQTETLRGDIRDALLTEFKQQQKPWQAMNEDEQDRLIRRANDIAGNTVRGAIDIVAAKGLPAIPIEVGKLTMDGAEIEGKFSCFADDEMLLRVRHLQNARAMFVLASPAAFNGEQQPAEAEVVGDLAMPKGPNVAAIAEHMAKG